ncbi:MAG: hypothetical protein B6242_14440 [Anaerolineaceae bacterium 4572_78]|nr:MAG: hypothetical protein B6242_14440 [Anaerolineaceae bacterium 4572_78]
MTEASIPATPESETVVSEPVVVTSEPVISSAPQTATTVATAENTTEDTTTEESISTATNVIDDLSLVPPTGKSRLFVFNEFKEELTFTIDDLEHKIPVNGQIPIDLEPGKYTYTISIPGGAVNGSVEMSADESWGIGVRSDGAVYNPTRIYPKE